MTKEEVEAEIGSLDRDFDGATCTYYWRASVWFAKKPELKLGKCKVIQS